MSRHIKDTSATGGGKADWAWLSLMGALILVLAGCDNSVVVTDTSDQGGVSVIDSSGNARWLSEDHMGAVVKPGDRLCWNAADRKFEECSR